jgi:FkbM family methyltransferase
MHSYSQCGEDLHLLEHYFKDKKGPGVFLELGALDGVLYSNTKLFEDELGWTGILIEPNPDQFVSLLRHRPRCKLYQSLVSDSKEPCTFRFFRHGHAAVSGVQDTLPAAHHAEYFDKYGFLPNGTMAMTPVSLTEIVKDSGFQGIDLLSLDVEGHELNVLRSYDFSVPIRIILIENLENTERDEECRKLLEDTGYVWKERFQHNDIYELALAGDLP